MFCSNCGKPLNSNDKFCKSCGFPNQNNNLENNGNNNQNNFNMNLNNQINNNQNGLNNNPNVFNMNQNEQVINNSNGFNINQNRPIINNQNEFSPNSSMINQENNRYESTNNIPNQFNNNNNSNNSLLNRILHGKNRNLYIVIGILSIISLICITLVIVNAFNKLKDNNEQISTQTETINLGGTTYQVPNGYQIKESGDAYYILQDDKFLFKIALAMGDYNTYKTNLNSAISEIVKAHEAQGLQYVGIDNPTIGGREYIILQFSSEGKIVTFYITKSNYANYIYCGNASNKLLTYNSNDFLDITTMLLNPNASSFDSSKVGDIELGIDLNENSFKGND